MDSEWLFAGDIWPDGKNRDVVVEISAWSAADLVGEKGRKSKKPAVAFKGKAKKLALNATNSRVLESLYGGEMEGWVGKRITLFRSTTRDPQSGLTIPCIRIRPEVPSSKSATERPDPEPTTSSQEASDGPR